MQSSDEEVDGRSGAVIGFSKLPVAYSYNKVGELTSIVDGSDNSTLSYDAEHRLYNGTTRGFSQETATCAPSGAARGFGGEARSNGVSFTNYVWGPDDNIDQAIFYAALAPAHAFSRNLHYAAKSLLFTDQSDQSGVVNSIKLGSYATIATASNGQTLLGISDRELDGSLTSDHNSTGHNSWTVPNSFQQPCTPKLALPGASSGYVGVTSDHTTEPAPNLIDDGLNLVRDGVVFSAMTLGSVVAQEGHFTLGLRSGLDCANVTAKQRSALDASDCGGGADIGGGAVLGPPISTLPPPVPIIGWTVNRHGGGGGGDSSGSGAGSGSGIGGSDDVGGGNAVDPKVGEPVQTLPPAPQPPVPTPPAPKSAGCQFALDFFNFVMNGAVGGYNTISPGYPAADGPLDYRPYAPSAGSVYTFFGSLAGISGAFALPRVPSPVSVPAKYFTWFFASGAFVANVQSRNC